MKFDSSQKKILGEYCGNLSIAWLAAGVIGPVVTKQVFGRVGEIVFLSILASSIFLLFMLILSKERRKRR